MSNLQEFCEDLYEKINKIVDIPFAEKILRDSEKNASLQVLSICIKPATNKGDNYTSDMFRATVEYTQEDQNQTINETKSLIVKVVPLAEGILHDMVSSSSLFITEIEMMTNTLVQMNKLLGPDCPPLNGRCLYTQFEDPTLLVIEDLATLGFRKPDRQDGLDFNHCLLTIRNLARFHASSLALLEKDPNLKNKYRYGLFSKSQPAGIHEFFNHGAVQAGREIANWSELDPRIPEKIQKIAGTIFERGTASSEYRENEFIVLNHGDCSVNNMLFKYDELNQPIAQIFVDFQLSLCTSPAIDLNFFFNTSLSEDSLLLYEEKLINEYTQTLVSTMKQTNCVTKPPSIDKIKFMMREHALYGMVASVSVLPMMLVDKEEVNDVSEVLAKGENSIYKGKLFRQAMIRRLPKFDQMGLLD